MSRRLLLSAAPAILSGAPRTWSEVEKLLASGNVKGKLAKADGGIRVESSGDALTPLALHRLDHGDPPFMKPGGRA